MKEEIDPANSTAAHLGRKAFVGLSLGAMVLTSDVAQAFAEQTLLGKPHAPLVPEDDPSISVERPTLTLKDRSLSAYAAYPRSNSTRVPGIVVMQHIWGVDAQLRDTVRRLAQAGYVAIAPELYAGMNAPNGDGATDYRPFADVAARMSDPDQGAIAGATWVRSRAGAGPAQRPPKVGIMGFCMGGDLALRAASDTDIFDALVVFYGSVRRGGERTGAMTNEQLAYTSNIKIPLMGQYGERDTSILPEDVRTMQKRLQVPNDIKIYGEAGHAFFDDTRERYIPSAAADAWQRTLAWFGKYLKA